MLLAQNNITKSSNEKRILLNSIILALFISINMLTKMITSIVMFNNNILILSIVLICISLSLNGFKIKSNYLFMTVVAIILLLVSALRIDNKVYTINYITNFILYGIIFTYTIQFEFKFEYIVKTINFISYFYCIYLIFIIWPQINSRTLDIDFTMDLAYTSSIAIISILMYGMKNRNIWEKILNILSLAVNLNMILNKSANRGVFLVIISFLFINFLFNSRNNYTKTFKVAISILFIGITLINIKDFLIKLNIFLINLNLDIPWITKITMQMSLGDITSGREHLYNNAISIFYENPFIGKGIGYYESLNGGLYTHNLVLDLLVGIGIIGTIFIIFIIVSGILSLLNRKLKRESKQVIIFLFSLSIPRLMVSSTIWYNHIFWMYMCYICVHIYKNKKIL